MINKDVGQDLFQHLISQYNVINKIIVNICGMEYNK